MLTNSLTNVFLNYDIYIYIYIYSFPNSSYDHYKQVAILADHIFLEF